MSYGINGFQTMSPFMRAGQTSQPIQFPTQLPYAGGLGSNVSQASMASPWAMPGDSSSAFSQGDRYTPYAAYASSSMPALYADQRSQNDPLRQLKMAIKQLRTMNELKLQMLISQKLDMLFQRVDYGPKELLDLSRAIGMKGSKPKHPPRNNH